MTKGILLKHKSCMIYLEGAGMIDIYFDKLYRYERASEPCSVCIPLKEGELYDTATVNVLQNGGEVPVQAKATARYSDGSVKYLFIRFMADLPANKGTVLKCELNGRPSNMTADIDVRKTAEGYCINAGKIKFEVSDNSRNIFKLLDDGNRVYRPENFEGPFLVERDDKKYGLCIDSWRVVENGAVCCILAAKGSNISKDGSGKKIDFELRITAYAGKPWLELSYRIINTSSGVLDIESLVFYYRADDRNLPVNSLTPMNFAEDTDSTGCGDRATEDFKNTDLVFHTRGTKDLELLSTYAPVSGVRTMVGSSNYKTDFYIGRDGNEVNKYVDDNMLINEANEHYSEVLYGTFMADRTDDRGGVCITVFQAQQNYPKAVKSDEDGIAVMLVPKDIGRIVMQPGMAREQKLLMHFHGSDESLFELDNRSLIYQMPDRPFIDPAVFRESGVMLDVFPEKLNDDVEMAIIGKADGHARCYGMLNWGDSPDSGYTLQGRGHGKQVWTNNEYDCPHSYALQYARTGVRRFLDYLIVAAGHWMDVDVCHYSEDPLKIGGQWEHTAGHTVDGVMVCSHEWVEGLLDYYHFTGDERGFETAVGIGENVLRLLDTPAYAVPGEANARETGWALRTLTALYVETHDEKWMTKSEWIIDSFKTWEEEYGYWLAPYTDNTAVRVGFMISVAVGSVMRYYRVKPRQDIKEMLIRVVDDLIENCLLDCGVFYYKELPSLQRLGNNTLLLESLAIAYELTGDVKYLKPGIKTFEKAIKTVAPSTNGAKKIYDDAVVCAGTGTKNFAQSFIPLITYYKALSENGLW